MTSPALIRARTAVVCILAVQLAGASSAYGQDAPVGADRAADQAANPLAALNAELKEVLAAAGVPFSEEQEREVTLMMEERRRASEELFGNLMDFRGGPTQGQEADRLRSAIDWMRNEFLMRLGDYLTAGQTAAWEAHGLIREGLGPEAGLTETQFVRINNNAFTAEDNGFDGGGSDTDVVPRGGAGSWHGNAQFLIKDDALNARNAFAGNKPPYQERRLNADVSGPSIPGRLSSTLSFQQTESENVGTIRATLPDGIFALGITRPNVFRRIRTRQVLQTADQHTIQFRLERTSETGRNQGIGDFTLPERRSDSSNREVGFGVFPFSTLSSTSIHEARLEVGAETDETIPFSDAVRINVLDAFNAGGAQNRSSDSDKTIAFGNLYTRFGETLTIKAGLEGAYRIHRSHSTNNFGGTFIFSSLEAYLAGMPLTYRATKGDPDLEVRQFEGAAFLQADLSLSSQLTVMVGARYEAQQHLRDYDNLDPRVSLAYSPGAAIVIRGGGGIFHSRLRSNLVENQRRFDGTRQFEVIIDNPSYPDATSGLVRQALPSVRVTDADIVAPYSAIGMLSLERTFFSNLLFTVSYDFQREYHKLRTRNLNAPYDARFEGLRACTPDTPAEACRTPDPTRGNVINLESTGSEIRHNVRISARKRFSIFNGSVDYQVQRVRTDVPFGTGTPVSNAYDRRVDWGGTQQPTHEVRGRLNASLPLGIFVSADVSAHSGRHYTITTGRDENRDSNITDRPPGVAPYSERGPRYSNVDFNISKAFFLRRDPGSRTSGMNINVFANMTNAFNHVHYGTPSGVMSSPNFGRITSAFDPREIEAGVRFQF